MKTDTMVIIIEHDDSKENLEEALPFNENSLSRIQDSVTEYKSMSKGLVNTILKNKITGSELLYLASIGIKQLSMTEKVLIKVDELPEKDLTEIVRYLIGKISKQNLINMIKNFSEGLKETFRIALEK